MARRRKKDRPAEDEAVDNVTAEAEPDVRHEGPWDSTEKSPGDDPTYIDLGALLIRGRVGLAVQLPADGESEEIGSVVLVADDAALELRLFAATKSGGLWDEVRADLVEEVGRLGGHHVPISGPFGPELHIRVPVEMSDAEEGFQPSRIVGIEGPRWLLRATFLGDAGLNPSDEGLLMEALKDVIVVRGNEARIPREPLLLTLPSNATVAPDEG